MELDPADTIRACFLVEEQKLNPVIGTGQIHVLAVVPEGAVSAPDARFVEFQRAADRVITRFENTMEALASNLLHKSEKSYTDGALGQMECLRLKKRELIIDVAPIHDEAFWLPTIQQKANDITNEAAFDAFITPHFNLAEPVPNDDVVRPTEDTFRFGVAVEELFDSLILFESKLNINEAAFGQVVRYMQILSPKASASADPFG
ncbi:unnamed protein product [Aphanomyces euteiches]